MKKQILAYKVHRTTDLVGKGGGGGEGERFSFIYFRDKIFYKWESVYNMETQSPTSFEVYSYTNYISV